MNNLNSLILEGNVVDNGVLSESTSGFLVCKLQVAVNRFFKKEDGEEVNEVSYFDVECYGNLAERTAEIATKGRAIRIVGRLKQDRWTDSDGKTFSRVFVYAEHIEYRSPKTK